MKIVFYDVVVIVDIVFGYVGVCCRRSMRIRMLMLLLLLMMMMMILLFRKRQIKRSSFFNERSSFCKWYVEMYTSWYAKRRLLKLVILCGEVFSLNNMDW